ncbi:MAG: hypothetical protein MH204_06340 [Fimbriimonadaceae bacterium]|nr:hypothetical protein [Fimbriimonadaceae bacterium]
MHLIGLLVLAPITCGLSLYVQGPLLLIETILILIGTIKDKDGRDLV